MMNEAVDNRQLAGLGKYLRPLLSEAAHAFGMPNSGFVGISFFHPSQADARVMFAEYINAENRAASTYDADYVLPGACTFARAISTAARHDGRVWHYVTSSDEPSAVREPLAKEFPAHGRPQAIYGDFVTDHEESPILYFIAGDRMLFDRFEGKLETGKKLLIKTLRDALFLAMAADRDLGEWPELLAEMLPEEFPAYEEAQRAALARVRHPYLQSHDPTGREPELVGAVLRAEDRPVALAVRGVRTIEATMLLKGSFQDHNIYAVRITPHRDAKPFEAVLKRARQSQADKEIHGYFSLLPYFRDLRDLLPSAPLIFPTGAPAKDRDGRELKEREYAVVTPHLGGRSLFAVIEEIWRSAPDRVTTFLPVVQHLRRFMENIRPDESPAETLPAYTCIYRSHLGEEQRHTAGRYAKTVAQFTGALPPACHNVPMLSSCEERLVNPLWMLTTAPSMAEEEQLDTFWQKYLGPFRLMYYGHGDFHVGNVLYDTATSRVTILDFDYVGEHPEYDDVATLEASFVLATAASLPLVDERAWLACWPDTLRFLSGRLALGKIENNRLAHDIAVLVQEIRKKPVKASDDYMVGDSHYHAALVTALLRLFTSHSHVMKPEQFRPVGATALFWLGLLLSSLVRTSPNTTAFALDPFRDLLPAERGGGS